MFNIKMLGETRFSPPETDWLVKSGCAIESDFVDRAHFITSFQKMQLFRKLLDFD